MFFFYIPVNVHMYLTGHSSEWWEVQKQISPTIFKLKSIPIQMKGNEWEFCIDSCTAFEL